MTREEIISGLKFTVEMFLFDPITGEKYTEPRNDMDKTTIDACKGAIELLEQEPCEDAISREAALEINRWHHGEMSNELNHKIWEELKALPSAHSKPKTEHCKECKYFEYDSVAKVNGIPLIVAHEICFKMG